MSKVQQVSMSSVQRRTRLDVAELVIAGVLLLLECRYRDTRVTNSD